MNGSREKMNIKSRYGRASDESLDDTNRGSMASVSAQMLRGTVGSIVSLFQGTAGAVGARNEGATGGAGGRYTDSLKRLQLQLGSSHHKWFLMQSPTSQVWLKLQQEKDCHCQSYIEKFHISSLLLFLFFLSFSTSLMKEKV